ncbi:MAG: ABC transporter ATP-binding protein [Desulfomonilaceae bacterium]|nr:ABC transporter ATP-binding protein [Desulfomonilaceae bacterium]
MNDFLPHREESTPALLKCRDLAFRYGGHRVLENVSLTVNRGSLIGIIGPNGSGKTTLIRILAGMVTPDSGEVLLEGQPVDSLSTRSIARRMAVVEQKESNVFGFTTREAVTLGRFSHHRGLHFEDASDLQAVWDAMHKTSVADLAERPIEELSGGELQKMRIARALAQEPKLLLLDEPTNHLDLRAQQELLELLKAINLDGIAVLLVSHDINFVSRLCHRINLLHKGRFLLSGTPKEVITEQAIKEAFRVEIDLMESARDGLPIILPVKRLG